MKDIRDEVAYNVEHKFSNLLSYNPPTYFPHHYSDSTINQK